MNIQATDGIRTMYLRSADTVNTDPTTGKETRGKGHPVGCVVTKVAADKTSVSYQVSSHNPLDVYDRQTGRDIAIGRLTSRPIVVSLTGIEPKRHNILRAVLLDIVSNSVRFPVAGKITPGFRGFANRVGKAADTWLTAHRYPVTETPAEAGLAPEAPRSFVSNAEQRRVEASRQIQEVSA